MTQTNTDDRVLGWAVLGNLAMGGAGLAAAVLSHSQAVLVDAGFSLIGALSIFCARRISARAEAAPDRLRPLGYSADEAIFTTFRALLLLGLVLFALGSSAVAVVSFFFGSVPEPVQFEPLVAYFVVVGAICVTLWALLYRAWVKTGRRSDILRLEAKAAAFDGLMTGIAAIGIGAIFLMQDGPLEAIAPIGDRLLVLALCGFAVVQYARDFRGALGELAGVTAGPAEIATVRRAVRPAVVEAGARIVDLGVMKLGRHHVVTVFMSSDAPMTSAAVDDLQVRLQVLAARALPGAQLWLILSDHDRRGAPLPASG